MKIKLSPIRMDEQLYASLEGEVLTLNDEVHDLGPLEEGEAWGSEELDAKWLIWATRNGGELEVIVLLPYGPSAPESTKWPVPIFVSEDGPIALPAYAEYTLTE